MKGILNIAIIGGGIGGMCAAIQLRKQGYQVDLIEQRDTLKPLGAGISLSAATLRALKEIGVIDQVLEIAGSFSLIELRTAEGHKIIQAPVLPAIGAEDLKNHNAGILRTKLASILETRLRELGVNVIVSNTVEKFQNHKDGVDIQLTGENHWRHYDIVVGADGIHSKVRKNIYPDYKGLKFTHQGSWRIVIPRYFEHLTMYVGKTLKAGMTPISKEESYLFVLDHHEQDEPIPQNEWPQRLAKLLAEFGDPLTRIKQKIDEGEIEEKDIIYRPLYTHLIETPWYKDRIVLLGDAVHSTTPHLASGAGLAIEGGIILAEELARADSIEDAYKQYQARHFDRANLVISSSTRLGEIEISQGSPEEHRNIMIQTMQRLRERI